MIKLIASDLDGTLLQNDAQELTPRAVKLIRSLTQKGIRFVAQADVSMTMNGDSLPGLRIKYLILRKMVPCVSTRVR